VVETETENEEGAKVIPMFPEPVAIAT